MSGLRERKKRQTRSSLATAAVELLVSEGDEGATVAAIASRAGVSTRTFHNYFAGREDAFLCFLEDTFADWVSEMREAPAGETPFRVLRRLTVAMYDRPRADAASVPNLATVVEHVLAGMGPEGGARVRAIFDELREAVVKRSGGDLSPYRAQTLIHVCLSASAAVLDGVRDEALADGRTVPQLLDEAFDFVAGKIE